MDYYVYLLKNKTTNKFYIGQTKNLNNRLIRHNQGRVRATKSRGPWEVIHQEKYKTRSEAVRREKYLKSLKNRKYLEEKIIKYRCGVEE